MKSKKKLKEEIKKAIKLGSGAGLRIPASYHRVGKIEPACSLSDKQIMAIAKKRAKLRKWVTDEFLPSL